MISCRVAVVGGGLAGLAAAEFLLKRKVDVRLFEGTERVGGRVYTARNDKGQHFEVGAFSFADSDKTVNEYVNRFALEKIRHVEGDTTLTAMQSLGTSYKETLEDSWFESHCESFQTQTQTSKGYYVLSRLRTLHHPKPGLVHAIALNSLGKISYSLKGGNDQLPHALADELCSRLHAGFYIDRVEKEGTAYILNKSIKAEKVIVAVPLAAIQKMIFNPPLQGEKLRAACALPYTLSERVTFLANGDSVKATIVEKRADINKQGYYVFDWSEIPWLKGGDSCYTRETTYLQKVFAAPQGGIHFAGEHTSDNYARMNGALESGIRAASEVLADLRSI